MHRILRDSDALGLESGKEFLGTEPRPGIAKQLTRYPSQTSHVTDLVTFDDIAKHCNINVIAKDPGTCRWVETLRFRVPPDLEPIQERMLQGQPLPRTHQGWFCGHGATLVTKHFLEGERMDQNLPSPPSQRGSDLAG